MLRKATMGKRQLLKHSVNPVNQIDLENLKKWQDREPYVKMNDPKNLPLKFQELTVNDLPGELGFDKYGLIVQGDYAAMIRAKAITLLPEDEVGKLTGELPLSSILSHPPSSPTADQQRKQETPISSESAHLEERSPTKPSFSADSDSLRDQGTALVGLEINRERSVVNAELDSDSSSILSSPESLISSPVLECEALTTRATRVSPRTSARGVSASKPSFVSATNFAKPRFKVATKASTKAPTKEPPERVRCGCPDKVPSILLGVLDSIKAFQQDSSIEAARQLAPFQDTLCHRHLQIFAHLTSTIALAHKVVRGSTDSGEALQLNHTVGRRRTRSDLDVGGDVDVHKRQRLDTTAS